MILFPPLVLQLQAYRKINILSKDKYHTVHPFTNFDMPRFRLCSGSNVTSECMLALSIIGDFVNSSTKEGHYDGDYVFSSLWPLSTSPFSTISFLSRNFKLLFFGVSINHLLTVAVRFSDLSLASRPLIISSSITVLRTQGRLTTKACRTAEIFLPSEISH